MANTLKRWLKEAVDSLTVPILAVIAGLLVGTLFIVMAGKDPVLAYKALGQAVLGEPRMMGETLVSVIPLIFTGLSVALAFRCGLFNIGVEGQYLVAQIAAAWAGYYVQLPHAIHPAFALFMAALAGAAWASIAGVLKALRGVHEVIDSIMLNYVGLFLTNYLLITFMRAPSKFGSASYPIWPTAELAQGMIQGSRLHAGLWIALGCAVVVWFFLWKTKAGYEIRSVGLSPGAAEYAGINVKTNIILAMALSGAIAGLAGGVQTLALNRRFYEPTGLVGFGFDGIAVALVGRNHPFGVVLAALLFGALDRGGPTMQAVAGVPKAVVWVVQGTVILFVGAEGLWRFLKKRKAKSEVKTA